MHEQSAVHMADGYFRACGRPMAAMTSIGPGATNTIIGLATCYADSDTNHPDQRRPFHPHAGPRGHAGA